MGDFAREGRVLICWPPFLILYFKIGHFSSIQVVHFYKKQHFLCKTYVACFITCMLFFDKIIIIIHNKNKYYKIMYVYHKTIGWDGRLFKGRGVLISMILFMVAAYLRWRLFKPGTFSNCYGTEMFGCSRSVGVYRKSLKHLLRTNKISDL